MDLGMLLKVANPKEKQTAGEPVKPKHKKKPKQKKRVSIVTPNKEASPIRTVKNKEAAPIRNIKKPEPVEIPRPKVGFGLGSADMSLSALSALSLKA
jgi:hypothetical protein